MGACPQQGMGSGVTTAYLGMHMAAGNLHSTSHTPCLEQLLRALSDYSPPEVLSEKNEGPLY